MRVGSSESLGAVVPMGPDISGIIGTCGLVRLCCIATLGIFGTIGPGVTCEPKRRAHGAWVALSIIGRVDAEGAVSQWMALNLQIFVKKVNHSSVW